MLDEFEMLSGLVTNASKSEASSAGAPDDLYDRILIVFEYKERKLPKRYFSVPLILL